MNSTHRMADFVVGVRHVGSTLAGLGRFVGAVDAQSTYLLWCAGTFLVGGLITTLDFGLDAIMYAPSAVVGTFALLLNNRLTQLVRSGDRAPSRRRSVQRILLPLASVGTATLASIPILIALIGDLPSATLSARYFAVNGTAHIFFLVGAVCLLPVLILSFPLLVAELDASRRRDRRRGISSRTFRLLTSLDWSFISGIMLALAIYN